VQAAAVGFGIRIFKESRDRISYSYQCAMIAIQAKQQRHTHGFNEVGHNDYNGNSKAELQLAKIFNLLDRTVQHLCFVGLPC
jgi:hypothetical protein